MNDEIQRAVERLNGDENPDSSIEIWADEAGEPMRLLTKPLAALIEDIAKPWYSEGVAWCRSCSRRIDSHFDDCALVALVRAVNGEQPR